MCTYLSTNVHLTTANISLLGVFFGELIMGFDLAYVVVEAITIQNDSHNTVK